MTLIKLIIITQFLDAVTTAIALNWGAVELNPLPAAIGWPAMLTIKVIVVALLVRAIHKGWIAKLCGEYESFARTFMVVLTCLPVITNGAQLLAKAMLAVLRSTGAL